MTMEEILAKLDKKTRDRVQAASLTNIDKLPTVSIGLTSALNGGIGYGRQTLVWGNKSAGKSSMLLQTIGIAQKLGKVCVWVDSEGSFDPVWATALGVDTNQLIISKAKDIDSWTLDICNFIKAGVDVIVGDSISALIPSTYFEKGEEFKEGLEGTRQIGTVSKELGIAINKFNFLNKNTALILISQLRNKFGTYGASVQPMGGEAMKFYSTTVIKLWSSASEREQIMADRPRGIKLSLLQLEDRLISQLNLIKLDHQINMATTIFTTVEIMLASINMVNWLTWVKNWAL